MTLALLLTAVTGAWAQTETLLTTITSTAPNNTFTSGSKTFDDIATVTFSGEVYNNNDARGWFRGSNDVTLTVAAASDAYTITRVKFFNDYNYTSAFDEEAPFEAALKDRSAVVNGTDLGRGGVTKIEVYGTAEAPVTVDWNASTKTGTFSMPGSDVVLTPIYAKAAAFATTGTEPEVKTLLPEAAEGVIAGTDAPLIKEGTGIVAFAGTSTEVTQGTLMYAVTPATVTEAPALDAANKWSATVPTAKTVADDGADVLVWYYIQGADAPEGDAATLDNTFSDTEPACLTVQVLTNKFDIQFNAANANTIEAGKATVTVAGAAATVTDGKLKGVKMGSEVKLEAKPGYKFRKVEVKKTEAAVKVTAITLNKTATTITAGQTETLSVSSVTPDDATDQTVTWSSDNEAVATVDADGKVTAVALGTANITATANDGSGVTATCAVTVNKVVTINQSDWGDGYSGSFTKDGVTVSAEIIDSEDGNLMGGGTFSTTLGNFTKIVVTTFRCNASGTGWSGSGSSMTWAGTPASTVSFSGEFMGRGRTQTTIVCTIEPTN